MRSKRILRSTILILLASALLSATSAQADEKANEVLNKEADSGKAKRKFSFTYTAKIETVPQGAKTIRVWLPVPQTTKHQKISELEFAPRQPKIAEEPKYGNRIAYWEFNAEGLKPTTVSMTFECERSEIAAKWNSSRELKAGERKILTPFLSGTDLVLVGEPVKDVAQKATQSATSPAALSKAAYDYVLANMAYSKKGSGWGTGSTKWACDSKYGNCTDFHALFLSITRTKGMPSKFEMGFPLPAKKGTGTIGGYHCWAKFYLGGVGWVPVDISEAFKHKDLATYYYGNLTPDRVQFTTGRDLDLVPKQNGKALNYFVHPYAEADGKPLKLNKAFSFKDL